MRSVDVRCGFPAWQTVALVLTLGVAAAPPASAQAVYRCEQKGKPVSLQSLPCDGRAKTTAIRGYVPEPAPTANELAWKRYRTDQEMTARNNSMRRAAGYSTTVVVPSDNETCAEAKAARDAWEKRMGLNRSLSGLRIWQDRVYQACR
jgi:hypothetical protein